MSLMNVVDVKMEDTEAKDDDTAKAKSDDLDPEDRLWIEFLKTLDKLEKGVDGDLSSLGRATRNLNRFRKRFPSTTWVRILHTIIPANYRQEFRGLLTEFIADVPAQEIAVISKLSGVSPRDATSKLQELDGDVFGAVKAFIAEKEKMAKVEIKKKQEELKKEREARDKKKGSKPVDAESASNADDAAKESDSAMDVDGGGDDQKGAADDVDDIKVSLLSQRRQKRKFYPETYIFLELLIATELYDREQYRAALTILERLISFSKRANRRTADGVSSRLYQFHALCTQRLSASGGDLSSVRHFLFENYQTACLQQNEASQAMLIVLILQCFVASSLYSLAHKFVEKAEFPESAESPIFARYHYYRGRIDCVQLQYSDSLYHFQQAIRRAPQTGAHGFKITATRWLIVIQLLMGDVPDRSTFKPRFDGNNDRNNPELNEQLAPFLEITECVKEGDLGQFRRCLSRYSALFEQCGLKKVLLRLRHNVIKTGLRKINRSYSRISWKDIASKLSLSSEDNAYFIVSKAIRDGVISAKIDYKNKFVESADTVDVYSTSQPYSDYAQRIKFCLEIRNQAVKNLRYPPKDEDEDEKKEDVDDDDVSPEEIAEMIQKQFEEEDDE